MGAAPKGTVRLVDGREVTVDVSTLKQREWRAFWTPGASTEEEDRIISRLTSLSVDELADLLRDDFRRIVSKIIDLANRPLDDPN